MSDDGTIPFPGCIGYVDIEELIRAARDADETAELTRDELRRVVNELAFYRAKHARRQRLN